MANHNIKTLQSFLFYNFLYKIISNCSLGNNNAPLSTYPIFL